MISVTDPSDLQVEKLSSAQKQWIRRLEKVLSECPDRLQLMVTGDRSISVVDSQGAASSELGDGAAFRDGVVLATVTETAKFHGVSW